MVRIWVDSEGNVWHESFDTITSEPKCSQCPPKGFMSQSIHKATKAGEIEEMEFVVVSEFNTSHFPTTIDPKSPNYRLRHRAVGAR